MYPNLIFFGKSHIYAFNNGSEKVKIAELKAWEMAKPRINIEDDSIFNLNTKDELNMPFF